MNDDIPMQINKCKHTDLEQSERFLDACPICLEAENDKLKKDLETATLALKAIASMPDSSEISRLKEMLERSDFEDEKYIKELESVIDKLQFRNTRLRDQCVSLEFQNHDLREMLERMETALEEISKASICECWDVVAFGATPKFIGCKYHNSDDKNEMCLTCTAQDALAEYQKWKEKK